MPKKINRADPDAILTSTPTGGRPPMNVDDVLRAILYRLREGCTWRALSIFGSWQTIYGHWRRWVKLGIFDSILDELAKDAEGKTWSIDSTSIKVHKHANRCTKETESVDNEQVGKSRGGRNTKAHAMVDSNNRILKIFISQGNRHDVCFANELVAEVPAGVIIIGDKSYDSDKFREDLEEQGLGCCIPPRAKRLNPSNYDKDVYKERHKIENAFQRLKEYRAIATRYEKLAVTFKALLTLASILDWM